VALGAVLARTFNGNTGEMSEERLNVAASFHVEISLRTTLSDWAEGHLITQSLGEGTVGVHVITVHSVGNLTSSFGIGGGRHELVGPTRWCCSWMLGSSLRQARFSGQRIVALSVGRIIASFARGCVCSSWQRTLRKFLVSIFNFLNSLLLDGLLGLGLLGSSLRLLEAARRTTSRGVLSGARRAFTLGLLTLRLGHLDDDVGENERK
jgi:hypothetical protein